MELEAGKRGLKSHARGNIESPKPALLGDTGGVLPTSGGRKALSTFNGWVSISGGASQAGTGGSISMPRGRSSGSSSGDVSIGTTGNAGASGVSSDLNLTTGSSSAGSSGDTGTGGHMLLGSRNAGTRGSKSHARGNIDSPLANLPRNAGELRSSKEISSQEPPEEGGNSFLENGNVKPFLMIQATFLN